MLFWVYIKNAFSTISTVVQNEGKDLVGGSPWDAGLCSGKDNIS